MTIDGRKPTAEEFDRVKKKIISEIEEMTVEDDPHLIVIGSKGHDTSFNSVLGCREWITEACIATIREVTGAAVSVTKTYDNDMKSESQRAVDEIKRLLNDDSNE